MTTKAYVLYDARARDGNTDDAQVIDTADSPRKCRSITRENKKDGYMTDAVWYEYDIEIVDGKSILINRTQRLDL